MNPWLQIPLEDYEAHMAMSSIGQAQFLAGILERRARELRAASLAVIGCAGGNGFDGLAPETVERVVGVDINPAYISTARARHEGRFRSLELICGDFVHTVPDVAPTELVFAALVLEYVNYTEGFRALANFTQSPGSLVVVLQLPHQSLASVSPSPFLSLIRLESLFCYVPSAALMNMASPLGLTLKETKRHILESGKAFDELLFIKKNGS
jgi:SAM-dependent methyltransferase